MEEEKVEKQINTLDSIGEQIGDFFYELFNIRKGLDWIGTVASIRNKVSIQGENMWMLICATMIASVGLNLNSGAVIIGAMLISPLMSPILGIGLGMAINDRLLLMKAVKNFTIATIFAIITSVLYFKFITPIKDITPEIQGRTTPTILDALVAIFGGVAGIVAVSRKDKGAAIPGVAIATALLPPLSVSGFGLAIGNYKIFTHSFYLFFLNSMLIAFATFLIVRFLGFPMKEHQTKEGKRKATIAIAAFIVALLVPGFLILKQVLGERQLEQNVNSFFQKNFDKGENQMFGKYILENNSLEDTLYYSVSYRGNEFSKDQLNDLNKQLSTITNKTVYIDPTLLNLTSKQVAIFDSKNKQLNQQMSQQSQKEVMYQQQISDLQNRIDSLNTPKKQFADLEKEVKALWPEFTSFSYGQVVKSTEEGVKEEKTILIEWDKKTTRAVRRSRKEQLKRYLETKIGADYVLVER